MIVVDIYGDVIGKYFEFDVDCIFFLIFLVSDGDFVVFIGVFLVEFIFRLKLDCMDSCEFLVMDGIWDRFFMDDFEIDELWWGFIFLFCWILKFRYKKL